MKSKTLRIINTVFFGVTVIINVLANILPLGIGDTGAVSEKYPNLFTPAPITFAVWGVIYLMMTLFLLWQWGVLGSKEDAENDLHKIGLWFAVSCLANIGWIFSWHFDVIWLSALMIIALLASLAVIGMKIKSRRRAGLPYFAVNAGFDLYFGWIIAAVIANISVLLVNLGWNGFGLSPVLWTCIILVVGAFIGALPALKDRKWFSTLAVIWAYAGILIRHLGQDGYAGKYPFVIGFAIIGIVIMLSAMLFKAVGLNCSCKKTINE